LDAIGEQGAGAGRTARGVGQELQPAAHLARRVLDSGQAAPFHLRPVMRDIAKVLGIGGDLLERPPGSFEGRQVLLALIFSPALFDQPVLVPDALHGQVRKGQIPFALESLRAEGGKSATQRQDLACQFAGDLVRAGARSARELLQPFQTLGPITAYPLADGGHGGGEGPGGILEAVLAGVSDQAEAIIKSVLHVTNHVEIRNGSRHRARILTAPHCLGPPHQGSHLSHPLLAHTLQSQRGDTMYLSNSEFNDNLTSVHGLEIRVV
jgi:hypothetical protein